MSTCTGWFDYFGPLNWKHCCEKHDTEDDTIDMLSYDREFFRMLSNQNLRDCVNKVLPGMGTLMYWGLVIFGPIYQRLSL